MQSNYNRIMWLAARQILLLVMGFGFAKWVREKYNKNPLNQLKNQLL